MPTLKRPDLDPRRGYYADAFLSVYTSRIDLGMSKSARKVLDADTDEFLHLAFDRTYAPYVGVINERTSQQEPRIRRCGSSIQISSARMCRELLKVVDGEVPDDKTLRFYFDDKTITDDKTGATLHRLEVPEV